MSYKGKLIYLIVLFTVNFSFAESSIMTTNIPFRGSANGGDLILVETLNRNARHIILHTIQDEPAESVAHS